MAEKARDVSWETELLLGNEWRVRRGEAGGPVEHAYLPDGPGGRALLSVGRTPGGYEARVPDGDGMAAIAELATFEQAASAGLLEMRRSPAQRDRALRSGIALYGDMLPEGASVRVAYDPALAEHVLECRYESAREALAAAGALQGDESMLATARVDEARRSVAVETRADFERLLRANESLGFAPLPAAVSEAAARALEAADMEDAGWAVSPEGATKDGQAIELSPDGKWALKAGDGKAMGSFESMSDAADALEEALEEIDLRAVGAVEPTARPAAPVRAESYGRPGREASEAGVSPASDQRSAEASALALSRSRTARSETKRR